MQGMESPEDIKRVECPEPVEGLSWIYILQCRNNTLYVGQTSNVAAQLKRHTDGAGARHTAQLKQFRLIYVEGPIQPNAAIKREQQLNKWSHAKKLALARGDTEKLKKLSLSRE